MKIYQQVTKYCAKEEKLLINEQFLLFSTKFLIYLELSSQELFHLFWNVVVRFIFFLNSTCRGTDISNYFRECIELLDNERRLYM